MSLINPLSALALLDIAKKGGHRTLINTAAASTLGQMLQRMAPKEGIQIVHIVRRDEHVELLKKLGASMVLNSTDTDFETQLRELCKKHQIRLALDAIGGSMTDILLKAVLRDGKVIIYSRLSGEQPCVSYNNFIGPDKSLGGFLVSAWAAKRNFLQNLMMWRRAQQLMGSDLHSEIRARVSLQEAPQAVKDYQDNMSGGKILFVPGII
jgi:NADPH:quinone reductase-like Zn-dependent oxidoreductase